MDGAFWMLTACPPYPAQIPRGCATGNRESHAADFSINHSSRICSHFIPWKVKEIPLGLALRPTTLDVPEDSYGPYFVWVVYMEFMKYDSKRALQTSFYLLGGDAMRQRVANGRVWC